MKADKIWFLPSKSLQSSGNMFINNKYKAERVRVFLRDTHSVLKGRDKPWMAVLT